MPQLRKDDVGTILRITVTENGLPFNASAATANTLKLRKPDGTVVAVAALFQTTGADGVFVYTVVADDLDQKGPWVGQLLLTFPTGRWHTDQFSFHVGEVLEESA